MKNRKNNIKTKYNRRKKSLTFMLFTLGIVIGVSLTFFAIATKAQETEETFRYKYFTQVEIAYGETLDNIADRFYSEEFRNKASYIQEIRNINSLYSNKQITPGTFLIVPYYDNIIK